MSSSSDTGSKSPRRGLVATLLAVAVAAGVVAAAVIDSGRGSDAAPEPSAPGSAVHPTTARVAPSYFDLLSGLPQLPPGALHGRLLTSMPDCNLTWTDLGTHDGAAAPGKIRQCLRGRYTVDSAFGSDRAIVRGPDYSVAAEVPIPPGWSVRWQTEAGFAMCGPAGRAVFVAYRGGRRRLPDCPGGVIDGRFFYLRGDRTLVDERGREVLRLRRRLVGQNVRQLSSGVVLVEPFQAGDTDLYSSGRYRGSVPTQRAGSECSVSSVSDDHRTVLAQCGSGGALAVFRDGEPHPVNPLLASQDAVMSPDGRWLLVHLASIGYAVVVDAETLTPRYRIPMAAPAALLEWDS
jgi:hypothetical protein